MRASLAPSRALYTATLGACVALAACSGAPERPPVLSVTLAPPSAPVEPASPEPTLVAPAAAPAAPDPALLDVGLGAEVACEWTLKDWHGEKTRTSLSLLPGEPAYASTEGGSGSLSVPVGPAGDALLAVEDQGYRLRGHVTSADLDLRPARFVAFGGFLAPTVHTHLGYREGKAGALEVTVPVPEEVQPTSAVPAAQVACDGIAIAFEGGGFDAMAPVVGKGPAPLFNSAALSMRAATDLAIEPGGPVVARLRPSSSNVANVDVLERRGAYTRIAWFPDTVYVFGWVRTSALAKAPTTTGWGSGHGRLGGQPTPPPEREDVVCPRDVDLNATLVERSARVGTVRAGTVIAILKRSEGRAVVFFGTRKLSGGKDTAFWVDEREIGSCHPAP